MWSLAEGFFKQNFCHACHTRFAVVFPLPSCCVRLLFLSAVTEQSWDTLKASRRRGRWERREGKKKETHLPAHALPSFYILKISRKLKKITSNADFLRRSPKNVCVGGYKRDYFGRSKPGCHGLLRVLDSESLLAEASFLLLFGAFTGREDSGNGAMRSEEEKQGQGVVKWPWRF